MQIDYTDLAVCVRADSVGGKLDPKQYLDCGEDYEKMSYKRFCLALGIDEEYLKDKTAEQYKEIFRSECERCFCCDRADDPLNMAVILSTLFDYTHQGINGSFFISHDSGSENTRG